MTTVAPAAAELPQLRVEPRCRICRDQQVRQLVNELLSHGHGCASIVRILEPVNAARPGNRQITDACVRKHRKRHFDLQAPASAVWRRVLEDRAAESQAAFEDGVAGPLNAASYLDVMMHKGYETLVDENTVISPQEGAWAAKQLHELTRQDAGVEKMAEMHVRMNRIIDAFRELPEEYQQMIFDKLEGREAPALAGAKGAQEVEEFDPGEDEGFDEEDLGERVKASIGFSK